MAWTLWALVALYAVSLALLMLGLVVARRSRLFRRFLVGEQGEEAWRRRDA